MVFERPEAAACQCWGHPTVVYLFVHPLPALRPCAHLFACLPRSQVPAWPYVSASFAIGVFALLPYTALWTTCEDQRLPLPKNQLVCTSCTQ